MVKIRLIVADDHALFREGILRICQHAGDLDVVGEAQNGQEAVALAARLRPDVILMDINMPVLDGVQATRTICGQNPEIKVIILTMYRQENHLFDAVSAGARGYLLKDVDWRELLDAIRRVHGGEALINPALAARMLDEFRRLANPQAAQGIERLAPAETEILTLVAQGLPNCDIAGQLGLTESSVCNRLTDIYRKLHVNNRVQAALYALRHGLVTLHDQDE
jgi:NarL family two-component system response regulator LiaR